MTYSNTPRLGLSQWSSPTDNPTRAEFNSDNEALETFTLIWLPPNTLANRPAAGIAGRLFYSTDYQVTFLDIGGQWVIPGQAQTGTSGFRLLPGQTNPLVIFQDASGNVKSYIDSTGRFNGRTYKQAGGALTPASGWQNYITGYAPCGYWVDSGGFVHLQGTVLAQSTYNGGGSTILADGTLPLPWDGCTHLFSTFMNGGSSNDYGGAAVVPGPVTVGVTGNGALATYSGTFNSGQNVFLDGMGYQSNLY